MHQSQISRVQISHFRSTGCRNKFAFVLVSLPELSSSIHFQCCWYPIRISVSCSYFIELSTRRLELTVFADRSSKCTTDLLSSTSLLSRSRLVKTSRLMQCSCKLHHSILFLSFIVTLSGNIFLVQLLNKKYGSNVVLLLMNSPFNTHEDT